jgi:hypothetical protein
MTKDNLAILLFMKINVNKINYKLVIKINCFSYIILRFNFIKRGYYMLTIDLRTTGMSEIIKLWNTDKEKLKWKLQDDYDDLVKEYRNQIRIYTQLSHKSSVLTLKYWGYDKINYTRELELNTQESIKGTIKFTKDLAENIKISLKIVEIMRYQEECSRALELSEIIRLKAREIEDTLELLDIKVSYDKDFCSKRDEWLHEDLRGIDVEKE